jgi:hypothetical protein
MKGDDGEAGDGEIKEGFVRRFRRFSQIERCLPNDTIIHSKKFDSVQIRVIRGQSFCSPTVAVVAWNIVHHRFIDNSIPSFISLSPLSRMAFRFS